MKMTAQNWSLFRRTPNRLSFDVRRSVELPCSNAQLANKAAVCLIHPIISRGIPWRWSLINIGHAAQFLFKCWSFFQQHPSLKRYIVDRVEHRTAFRQMWSVEIMNSMHAVFSPGPPRRCAVVWSAPTRYWYPGFGESWFHNPLDAWQLTSAVLDKAPELPHAGLDGERRGGQLHDARVGVLEREMSRRKREITSRLGAAF